MKMVIRLCESGPNAAAHRTTMRAFVSAESSLGSSAATPQISSSLSMASAMLRLCERCFVDVTTSSSSDVIRVRSSTRSRSRAAGVSQCASATRNRAITLVFTKKNVCDADC